MPTAKKRSSGPAARAPKATTRSAAGARAEKASKPTPTTRGASKAAPKQSAGERRASTRKPPVKSSAKSSAKGSAKRSVNTYDCARCPAYCCSIYERVEVTKSDLVRLAAHLGLSIDETKRKHTKLFGKERVLRRRKDHLFPTACKFLDPETRGCTIYHGRPEVCRDYPGQRSCGYFDVIEFERRTQNDKHVLPVIQVTFPDK